MECVDPVLSDRAKLMSSAVQPLLNWISQQINQYPTNKTKKRWKLTVVFARGSKLSQKLFSNSKLMLAKLTMASPMRRSLFMRSQPYNRRRTPIELTSSAKPPAYYVQWRSIIKAYMHDIHKQAPNKQTYNSLKPNRNGAEWMEYSEKRNCNSQKWMFITQ